MVVKPTTPRETADAATVRRTPVRLAVVLDLTFVGGAEILLLNLFRHLNPAVVAPRVICLREAGDLAGDFHDAGFPVEVLDRTGRWDTHTLPRLVRSLRSHGTDAVLVVHHHRAALTLGRIAARLARVPANVVAVHDMDTMHAGYRCLPRHVVRTLFLSHAMVLLAASQGEYLRREEGVGKAPWSRTREVVIPNGISLPPPSDAERRAAARIMLGLAPDAVVLGIVARLSPQKAHHVLMAAVARLAPSQPTLRLAVIGTGVRDGELRALADRLGIADRVRFTGLRRDVPSLLPGLDVSCLSSVHEGAPISVIESMAAGVPVVATDCGALRDMVTDGEEGFIVPVGDIDALTNRLTRLIADPALRADLGRRARARAERSYRIEGTARGFEELLTSLVPA